MILSRKAERIVQHPIDHNRPACSGSDPRIVGTKEFISLSVLKKPPFINAVVLHCLFGNGAVSLPIMIQRAVDDRDPHGPRNGIKNGGGVLPFFSLRKENTVIQGSQAELVPYIGWERRHR